MPATNICPPTLTLYRKSSDPKKRAKGLEKPKVLRILFIYVSIFDRSHKWSSSSVDKAHGLKVDELMKGALVKQIEYRSKVHSFIFTWESIPNNNIIFILTILLPHRFNSRDMIE